MTRYAYLATGRLVPLLQGLARLRARIHNPKYIPRGPLIFVANRSSLLDSLLLPYQICRLLGRPVWSLALHPFCLGGLGEILERGGALCTSDPDRDLLMVQTLLTGEAPWIVFRGGAAAVPGGGSDLLAATLALRTEFYRQRVLRLSRSAPEEAERLCALFRIAGPAAVATRAPSIVPVHLDYYPLRARENVEAALADLVAGELTPRLREEILTEGRLFSGMDVDLRFAPPIAGGGWLADPRIQRDIRSTSPIGFDDRLPSLPVLRRSALALAARCQAQIESLATVNHDHLFASLLRALPLSAVQEEDLRRRVYLLCARCQETGVPCHRSVRQDQVALLTDDRYHKYRNFYLVAVERGVLARRPGGLFRARSPFCPPFNLHRGENPVVALADELLPLKPLRREVLKSAWLPAWLVRRLVVQRLERQGVAEFEADYAAFYRPGESKERDVGAPLLLRGRHRDLGIVLVHGFLAAPRQMAELAGYLHREGFSVYLVRLKGHGTAPEDLALRSGVDWTESVDRGYALMKGICREVVLGGFSFGGGVALDCASRVGKVAGVFAVCPPQRLMDISSRFVPAVAAWNRVMDLLRLEGTKMAYVQIVPERPQINYARLPIAALRGLALFMRQLEPKLAGIRAPALVVQGDGDPVVDPRGSRRLFDMLGSSEKEYRLFQRGRHGIVAGEGAEEVHAAIAEFVRGLRERRRGWKRS